MTNDSTERTVSRRSIKRLPIYLRLLRERAANGAEFVSSAVLAKELHLDPVVVRKDLAMTGVVGTPRIGFPVKELETAIVDFLGWDKTADAVLCGVGSLGHALLGYEGFSQHGLAITAAFDVSPEVIGTTVHGIKVFGLDKMESLIPRLNIRIGIITVPAPAAQGIANKMIGAGIRGIWNFTPVKLSVPDGIVIQRVDLASSLAVLSRNLSLLPPSPTLN